MWKHKLSMLLLKVGTCALHKSYTPTRRTYADVDVQVHNLESGLGYTSQFTCRVFHHEKASENVWTSTTLEEFKVTEDHGRSFTAKGVSVTLSADNKTYTIKVNVNPQTIVDFKVTRDTPGFKIGKDGTSIFGTDPSKPWGTIRHLFWPRCTVEGVILVSGRPIDVKGEGQFVHALQGMKP